MDEKCIWISSGYPILLAAIAALWKVYQGERKKTREAELLLLEEKDRRIAELEAFKKIVEDRHGERRRT